MNKPVGGRGQKAPYKTTIIRVPEPIAPRIRREIEMYRNLELNGKAHSNELKEIDLNGTESSYVTKSIALENANRILTHKKSARESLQKLLQVLYDDSEIKLKPSKR